MAQGRTNPIRLAPFVVTGRPASVQATRRARWTERVRLAAAATISEPFPQRDLRVQMTVFYKEPPRFTLDVDNASKPICDALKGVAYNDDNQLIDRTARVRKLEGSFELDRIEPVIIDALKLRQEFVAIEIFALGEG